MKIALPCWQVVSLFFAKVAKVSERLCVCYPYGSANAIGATIANAVISTLFNTIVNALTIQQ